MAFDLQHCYSGAARQLYGTWSRSHLYKALIWVTRNLRVVGWILLQVYVLYTASSLNGADCKTLAVREAGYCSGRVLEWRGEQTQRREVTVHCQSQVPVVHIQLWVSSHKQRELSTHVLDWLSHISLSNLLKLALIPSPEFDSGVPSSWDNQGLIVH